MGELKWRRRRRRRRRSNSDRKIEEGTLLDCIEGKGGGGGEEDWEEVENSATARNRFATLTLTHDLSSFSSICRICELLMTLLYLGI